ncbi:MAG: sulfotransferase [Bacteroidia bacterium]|nr:sulfotransferase [Bacteroidia bacterium]
MTEISGIQMIGTRRSGSNLLRLILDQLPEVSAPHPPHILRTFQPLLPKYGDLQHPENLRWLAQDICHWVELNPVPWRHIPLPLETILSQADEPSLFGLFRSVYQYIAQKDGAQMWLCKGLYNVRLFAELESSGPPLKYIWLVRDGRDVAVSMKKVVVGPKHIWHIAQKWKTEQELAASIQQKIGQERCLMVHYADLLRTPREELRRLCEFLGVKFRDAAVDSFYLSDESRITAASGAMWVNVGKPLIPNNVQKYKTELSQEEIQLFESVAGNQLLELGYSLEFPPLTVKNYSPEQIAQFEAENEILIARALELTSPEDLRRRAPQENFLASLKDRPDLIA